MTGDAEAAGRPIRAHLPIIAPFAPAVKLRILLGQIHRRQDVSLRDGDHESLYPTNVVSDTGAVLIPEFTDPRQVLIYDAVTRTRLVRNQTSILA